MKQEPTSQQNYAQKLYEKLQWAYHKAQENSKKESECHKKYYDQRMRCMKLASGDLVMVRVKALTGNHKIADRWEDIPYEVIDQLDDQPVFKVRPITASSDKDIKVLHRNMLFPIKTSGEHTLAESGNAQSIALMKANLLMDIYFND